MFNQCIALLLPKYPVSFKRFIIFNCYAISASFHSSDILGKPLQILVETEFRRIAFQPPPPPSYAPIPFE